VKLPLCTIFYLFHNELLLKLTSEPPRRPFNQHTGKQQCVSLQRCTATLKRHFASPSATDFFIMHKHHNEAATTPCRCAVLASDGNVAMLLAGRPRNTHTALPRCLGSSQGSSVTLLRCSIDVLLWT
jgi:hypothetical protein